MGDTTQDLDNNITMTEAQHSCDRRTFLVATATTLGGVLLAACGKQEPTQQQVNPEDVPLGSAVIVGDYIITHPEDGKYAAYLAKCPHAGAKINLVEGDTIICQAHYSKFKVADGTAFSGPATGSLTTAALTTADGKLVVG